MYRPSDVCHKAVVTSATFSEPQYLYGSASDRRLHLSEGQIGTEDPDPRSSLFAYSADALIGSSGGFLYTTSDKKNPHFVGLNKGEGRGRDRMNYGIRVDARMVETLDRCIDGSSSR